MKITFYTDVAPWMATADNWNFVAYSKPTLPKPADNTRYKFTIEIPDPRGESEPAPVVEGPSEVDEA